MMDNLAVVRPSTFNCSIAATLPSTAAARSEKSAKLGSGLLHWVSVLSSVLFRVVSISSSTSIQTQGRLKQVDNSSMRTHTAPTSHWVEAGKCNRLTIAPNEVKPVNGCACTLKKNES